MLDGFVLCFVGACGGYEWGSLNSDQLATPIADCEKIKADLDKLDLNVA